MFPTQQQGYKNALKSNTNTSPTLSKPINTNELLKKLQTEVRQTITDKINRTIKITIEKIINEKLEARFDKHTQEVNDNMNKKFEMLLAAMNITNAKRKQAAPLEHELDIEENALPNESSTKN